jgi:hypothetical protein
MTGYKYITEGDAIDARSQAATYMGLPNPTYFEYLTGSSKSVGSAFNSSFNWISLS